VPDRGTAARWAEALAGTDFRLCPKLPREVTHEARPDLAVLARFLDGIEALGSACGPLLVQLPARTGPAEMPRLAPVFDALAGRASVLEVRHPAFFEAPAALEPWLDRLGAGRVTLDARPLHRGDVDHPEVRAARHEKPDLPIVFTPARPPAFLRLVLHPDIEANAPWIEGWAERVAAALGQGAECYVMIHCPNNLHCPELATRFHEALRRHRPALEPLAPWPAMPAPPGQGVLPL